MTDKTYIEIDASPWLNSNGDIEVVVYLGESGCEPNYTETTSLRELIKKELEAYCSRNKIVDHHFEDVNSLLKNLKGAYKYAKKLSKEMGFDEK